MIKNYSYLMNIKELLNDILITLSELKISKNKIKLLDNKIENYLKLYEYKEKTVLLVKTNNKCNMCNRIASYQDKISNKIYYCWNHAI